MKHEEFLELLKTTYLNKKDFAEKTNLAYSTVGNWSNNDTVPEWVRSWIENYNKAKLGDIFIEAVRPYVNKA